MREYKGHQLRETHEQFEKLLQEIDADSSTLEIRSAGPSRHSVILNGGLVGVYNYSTGQFGALSGHTYEWVHDLLHYPDGHMVKTSFAEALRIILDIE